MTKQAKSWKKQFQLWRLGAVERYYFELKDNNTYPFEDLGDGFYYIQLRSDKFAFGIATIIIAITCFVTFSVIIGSFSFPLILFLTVLGYGVFCLYGNTSHKELIISRHGGYLLRIKGNGKILIEEPINNVYIKLQRKYDTNMLPHYYLILGGYRLDDIRLTGFGMNDAPLRILGSGVASRMGINFFDVDSNSIDHRILHYPGRSLITPPEDEFARFLKLHGITQEEVDRARKLEKIPADSIKAPWQIVSRVYTNYGGNVTNENEKRQLKAHYASSKPINSDAVRSNNTLQALLDMNQERQRLSDIQAAQLAAELRSNAKAANKNK